LGKALVVEGACFDCIVDICIVGDEIEGGGIYPLLEFAKQLDPLYTAARQPRMEAFWRTMVANVDAAEEAEYPVPIDMGTSFRAFICFVLASQLSRPGLSEDYKAKNIQKLDILHQLGDPDNLPTKQDVLNSTEKFEMMFAVLAQDPPLASTAMEIYQAEETPSHRFTLASGRASGFRRVFRTSRGYIGLCPLPSEVGDEVWLLQGALVPFVLREVAEKGKYEMIGEAYLHGFMNGEMLTEQFKENIAPIHII
jgi:hypothetical protein